MRKCIVCDGEITEGYIEYSSGNTWCRDACWEIDFTKQALAAGMACNELAVENWSLKSQCERCGGREQADGHEYCDECIEEMTTAAVVHTEQLAMEIGRVGAE